MKSKNTLIGIAIVLFVICILIDTGSGKASDATEVESLMSTEEELGKSKTEDLDELKEDIVEEVPIEHMEKLSSELSPDSPFQKLLTTGDVEITSIAPNGRKYVTLDSVRSIIPEFKGETYNELKEEFNSLKLQICVKDEFNVTENSQILSGQKVRLDIYPERSILIYPKDDHEAGISFCEYILYKNGKDTILEGIDYYDRTYYKLISEGNGKLHIAEKYNVDVPNESIIVHTSKDFTVTLEGKWLKIWQYGKVFCLAEIPKPANENEELFSNTYPKKESGKYYGIGKPYVDENGNLIQLKIASGSTELNVECLVLASDVAQIVSDEFDIVFKDKSGNYFVELLDEDDFGKETVELCQENIRALRLIRRQLRRQSNSDKLFESLWLEVWLKDSKKSVRIKVYTPSNPVPIDGELEEKLNSIENNTYYDVSECETSYNEIVAEMQRLEK